MASDEEMASMLQAQFDSEASFENHLAAQEEENVAAAFEVLQSRTFTP